MNRDITIKTTLGDDVLLFRRMNGTDRMSGLFEYHVELLTQKEDIALPDVIGQPMTIHLKTGDDKFRYFSGIVSRFAFVGSEGDYHRYNAVLRPWLWNLTRRSDCRIFQEMTVPDIIKEVFRDAGYSDFKESLSGEYRTWEYCVQYRETDFNFVSRLMENEGIYYYIEHEDGRHNVVLCDSINAHAPFPDFDEIKFFPPGKAKSKEEPHVFEWGVTHEYQPNIFACVDYDFKEPTKDLSAQAEIPRDHTKADSEIYDFPGEYSDPGDGDNYARMRIQELQAQYERCEGQANVPGISVGSLVSLAEHPRSDQNREYLVLTCSHRMEESSYDSRSGGGASYSCSFSMLPSKEPFRAPRTTPKPVVQGPQTALVVGEPGGDAVYCDEYGRVKVQFHWDREGQADDKSSCYIRVSQTSAGATWGAMFLPHVGQEVIVDFLEGDPDRPIITGRVYNADNMPPAALPDNKFKSVLRDHYGNEIVFNGKPGEEGISLHSPAQHSTIAVGAGFSVFTKSDTPSYTYGDKKSYHYGKSSSYTRGFTFGMFRGGKVDVSFAASMGVTLGAAIGITVGAQGSFRFGPDLSIVYGPKISWGKTRSWNHTKGQYRRSSKEEITLDSQEAALITGGKKDNTLLESTDKKISLTFDGSAGRTDNDKLDGAAWKWCVGSAVAVGALSALGAWSYNWDFGGPEKEGDEFDIDASTKGQKYQADDISKCWKNDLIVGAAILVPTLASMKAVSGADADLPKHTKPSARVIVEDDMVTIGAGEAPINGEAPSTITVERTGIEFKSKDIIKLDSKAGIVYETPKKATWKAMAVQIKAIIDHKNLKVLS